jgi:hypothetical protein
MKIILYSFNTFSSLLMLHASCVTIVFSFHVTIWNWSYPIRDRSKNISCLFITAEYRTLRIESTQLLIIFVAILKSTSWETPHFFGLFLSKCLRHFTIYHFKSLFYETGGKGTCSYQIYNRFAEAVGAQIFMHKWRF